MKDKVITIIGGGHGLSNILRGLKHIASQLNVIVDVTDSGGSTGNLRTTLNIPAMGDIRLVISTLSNKKLKEIFEYRIPDYKDCVGNLIMGSLIKLYDFKTAIEIVQKLMGVKETHKVIPVSLDNFDIKGEYISGRKANKEREFIYRDKIFKVWLEPSPTPNLEAIEAIRKADLVILSPGSFYTSILSNLMVPNISEEINKKHVMWIANIMQQEGETLGMDLQDHYNILSTFVKINTIVLNTVKPPSNVLSEKYEGYLMPLVSLDDIKGINIIKNDYLSKCTDDVLHDFNKIFDVIIEELKCLK